MMVPAGTNEGGWRAWVTASKPDVSLISVGSFQAVPMNVMPTGSPILTPLVC